MPPSQSRTDKDKKRPGEDRPVAEEGDLSVLTVIRECKKEAESAKRERTQKNRRNFDAYLSRQDWSHKQAGQSTEFLPETSVAVEQFSAFVKRALVQFGDWFSVDVPDGFILTPEQVRKLLRCSLESLVDWTGGKTTFALRISDAMKRGLLESLIVLKVHGRKVEEQRFFAESGVRIVETEMGPEPRIEDRLKRKVSRPWRLAIDLVPTADYFPDPSGRNLYEIHTVQRDLHDVIALAEQGIYDKAAVQEIEGDFGRQQEEWEKARANNQDVAQAPSFRKQVVIDEFWGTMLGADGEIAHANVVSAVADDRFLIRKPEPNPFWHGESPFVRSPLIRVPGSVWHKALYDDAALLNFAENELFNLMLDGGIASVWGTKQLRDDWLKDPRQVSGGVPQGITLAVKEDMPLGMKVMETLTEGEVPPDALQMFNLIQRQFQSSAMTNDLKLGLFPPKQIKATEVVEASQSQSVTLDSIAADIEQALITPCLEKAWMTILQNADDLAADHVVQSIGPSAAMMLARMTPEQRFAALSTGCRFKVHGLSATLARVRDFQKKMALLQAITGNPVLLQAFMKRFSPDTFLTQIMKDLNINPEHIEQTPEERAALGARMQELPFFQRLTGTKPGNGQGMAAQDTGEPQLPAEINQLSNPLTGMVG